MTKPVLGYMALRVSCPILGKRCCARRIQAYRLPGEVYQGSSNQGLDLAVATDEFEDVVEGGAVPGRWGMRWLLRASS